MFVAIDWQNLVLVVQPGDSSRPEVELPDAQLSPTEGQLALSIGEGQPKLYELQHVYIASAI